MAKHPTPDFNAGCRTTRKQMLAHIDVLVKEYQAAEEDPGAMDGYNKMRRWIKGMPRRAAKRVGGAGVR